MLEQQRQQGSRTSRYRHNLPQLTGRSFLTDGGLETVLVFQKEIDIAAFAAIDLMRRPDGEDVFRDYCAPYIDIAQRANAGLIIETLTWRASPDWWEKIGFASLDEMGQAIDQSLVLLGDIRRQSDSAEHPFVISGCIGPRGDGYDPGQLMTVDEAEAYHGWLIERLAQSEADMVSGLTMTNADEAGGIARAAASHGMPCSISFTVETDGRLPTGQTLGDAIAAVDAVTSASPPVYYMINCAHPQHFQDVLAGGGEWLHRLRGIRANASTCSHAELDAATELDDGDPVMLGTEMAALQAQLPHINVLGGCCGTDHRHIAEIARMTDVRRGSAEHAA